MKKQCQHKRNVGIMPLWSYFCLDCGRLNIDGSWQNKKNTIESLESYLSSIYTSNAFEKDRILLAIEVVKLK